jgi:hypothetical protein
MAISFCPISVFPLIPFYLLCLAHEIRFNEIKRLDLYFQRNANLFLVCLHLYLVEFVTTKMYLFKIFMILVRFVFISVLFKSINTHTHTYWKINFNLKNKNCFPTKITYYLKALSPRIQIKEQKSFIVYSRWKNSEKVIILHWSKLQFQFCFCSVKGFLLPYVFWRRDALVFSNFLFIIFCSLKHKNTKTEMQEIQQT